MVGKTVLIIDDDADLVNLLATAFAREGAQVHVAYDGRAGLRQFYEHSPDLVVLDILMPVMGGWQVFRSIREVSGVPVLILSVLSQEDQVVRALEAGAVDYVPKPFSVQVLLARARVALRVHATMPAQRKPLAYDDGFLQIDADQRKVAVCGDPVHLSSTEYRLLLFMVENSGRVVSKEEILIAIWGREYLDASNYVYLYMWRLRKKIEAEPDAPTYLVTARDSGYRFAARVSPQGT